MLSVPDLKVYWDGLTIEEIYKNTVDQRHVKNWHVQYITEDKNLVEMVIAQIGAGFSMIDLIDAHIDGIYIEPAQLFGKN